jgi:hypothetical protein
VCVCVSISLSLCVSLCAMVLSLWVVVVFHGGGVCFRPWYSV